MNKKRYLIIIILLIFIFLTIFSFANPFGNGEGEPNDNRVLEEIEEEDLINKDQQVETKPVDTPVYNNHGVNTDEKEDVKDNSYELALEAVIKAEVTLDKDNYDKAVVLVDKVKEEDKKEELEERLEEVLNSINVKELVEKLVKMTKSSTNKEELDAARKFETSNEIEDKISNLTNEVLKETLQKAVDNIAYLLDDTTVPTINIEDGAILNSDTKIEAEDENELTLLLNGTEIENNRVVTDGEYELVVTDEAFNEIKVSFIVDTKNPEGTLTYNIDKLTNKDVIVTLKTNEEVTVTNNDGKFEYTFTENGEFTFEFVDVAGNKGSVLAKVDYIDKALPEAEVAYNNEQLTNKNVIVKLTLSEEIKEVEGWTLSENKMTLTKELETNQEGKVTIEDLAGNTNEIEYSVTNIDKEINKPVITYSTQDPTNKNVVVTLTADEEVEIINAGTWNPDGGYGKVFKKAYSKNTKQIVTVRDRAGNETTVEVEITNIDTKINKPVISYSTVDPTRNNVVVTLTADEEVEIINAGTWNPDGGYGKVFKKAYSKNTKQIVTVRDRAGNETTIEVEITNIDTKINKPVISYSTVDPTRNNVVVTLTADEEVEIINAGTWNADGGYGKVFKKAYPKNTKQTVTVRDKAGNETTVEVEITNIDTEINEPTVTYSTEELTNQNVIVTITFDEEVEEVIDWTLSDDKKILTKEIEKNETDKITVTDLAGNTIEVSYSVTNIDKKPPTVTGVRNGEYYKEATPVVEDENLESIKLNGIEIKSGKKILLNGNYTLVATDKAGNTTTVTFTVDSIKPIILVLDFLDVIQTDLIPIKPVIIDANLDTVVVLKDGIDIGYKQGDQLEGEGSYEIIATDKAGNTTSTKFNVDNNGPKIKKDGLIPTTIPVIGGVYKEVKIRIDDENFDEKSIIVLKKSNESINLPFDYSLPKYTKVDYKYGDTITEEGEYIVLAADKALNISFVSFIIDTTAPTVNAKDGEYYQNLQLNVDDASLLSTVVYKKGSNGWYEKTDYTNGDLISEEGEYKVSATDKVLQNTTVEFTIDTVDPTIDGVVNNYVYLEATPVVSDTNLDAVVVAKDGNTIESQEKYTENGMYVITATDKAGRVTTVSFEIDSEALKINEPTGEMYLNDVTPVITHRVNITPTLTRNGEVISYQEGDTLTEAGNYTLTVADEYTNSVSVEFAIDKAAPTIEIDKLPRKVTAQSGKGINVLVDVTDDTYDETEREKILPKTIAHSSGKIVEIVDNKIPATINEAGVYTLVYEVTDTAGRTTTTAPIEIEVVVKEVSIKITTNKTTEDNKEIIENTYNNDNQLSKTYIPVSFVDVNGKKIDGLNTDNIVIGVYKRNNENQLEKVTQLQDAGEYEIIASIKENTPGYEDIEPAQVTYVIAPKELTVEYVLVSDSNEYDGNAKEYRPQVTTLESTEPVRVGENVTTLGVDANVEYTLDASITYSNSNYTIVDNGAKVKIDQAILTTHFPAAVDGKITPTFTNSSGDTITVPSLVLYFKKGRILPYTLASDMSQPGQYKVMVIVDDTDNYKQDPEAERFNILGYSGVVEDYNI